jgi:predicted transcriptional regulator
LADLPGDGPITVVHLHRVHERDPRDVLSADVDIEDVEGLRRKVAPYREHLRLIAENPGVRAPDLAARMALDVPTFKRQVRRLKELGLTHSLRVGYRLSPRGEAFLALD